MNQCLSCRTQLQGKYCHECGERVVEATDFTLKKIIGDGVNIFTNLDSKLFQSFFTLVAHPGKLTEEYILGRRKPYMKPFQIFLICTILFFLILSDFDAFLVPSRWFFRDAAEFGINIMDLVKAKMAEKSMSQEEVAILYDSVVAGYSKLFIVVLLPLIALFTFLFKRKDMPEFGKHFILAIHNFSFLVTWLFTAFLITFLTPLKSVKTLAFIIIFAVVFIYLAISFQRVWKMNWWKSYGFAALMFSFLFIIIFLYRVLISYLTLRFL